MRSLIKKKIKHIILFLFTYCIYVCNFIFKIKFSTVSEDRIGGIAAACDMHLRREKIDNLNTKLCFFIDNPCNYTLLGLLKKRNIFIKSKFLKTLLNLSKDKLIKKNIYIPVTEDLHSYREFYKTKPQIFLSLKQKKFGYQEISKWGIKENDWWVCFHGRDSNYLKKKYPNINFDYHNYRDFNPNTMIDAILTVISKGGYAIIMGEDDNETLNIDNKKLIHYNKKYKTDFLDIFLCAEAKFFIGNSSGLKAVSQCFNVPIAATNQIGFNVLLQPINSLTIYKKLYSIEKKRLLTFNEMKKIGLFDKKEGFKAYFTEYYKKNKLIPVENTKQEINGLVEDMFNLIDNNEINTIIQDKVKKKLFYGYDNIDLAGNIAPSFLKINSSIL